MTYIDDLAALVEAQLPPTSRPPEHATELYRLYALLALTTGEATSLENVHDAWSTWMVGVNPKHESLVPFADLPPEVQIEDAIYRDAIMRVTRQRPY